jgi:hypothetical protein
MLSQKLRPTFEGNPIKRWYREEIICREDCIAGTRKPWSILPKDGML